MNQFLFIHSEFQDLYVTIQHILNKEIFKFIMPLKTRIESFSLKTFKRLARKNILSSKTLEKHLQKIIEKELNEVEKMIFKMLKNEPIEFKDLALKFSFYKEFPQKKDLFINSKDNFEINIADLVFKHIYFNEDITELLIKIINELPFTFMVFYFLALKDIIPTNTIKNTLLLLKSNTLKIEYLIGLFALPEKECYEILATDFLKDTSAQKIEIFNICEVNKWKLMRSVINNLKENQNQNLAFGKFLRVMQTKIFEDKTFILWILFWLKLHLEESKIEKFKELWENVKSISKLKSLDAEFFENMYEFLTKENDNRDLKKINKKFTRKYKDTIISYKNVIDKYFKCDKIR